MKNLPTTFVRSQLAHEKKSVSKKDNYFSIVYSKVNLSVVPKDIWWVDYITHIKMMIQDCLQKVIVKG